MAKQVIVQLIDDLDGSGADETVSFDLDGTSYEIDLNKANAAKLRKALQPFLEKATNASKVSVNRSSGPGRSTAFSRLSDDEKSRYRIWANAPTARRIADSKVQEWIGASKP